MIRVLEKNVSDKIAAGEVIERPVSIIKELVENSVDAGSTSITVEIKNGGKSYIRVTDNGCGIPREEVETAFLRHATSKIVAAGDLDSISTLGFRGEALASIAAVTRTTMITKDRNEKIGVKVSLDGGEMVSNEGTGCPEGTTVMVSDLFFNTPARREFLRSDQQETSEISSFLAEFAIAFSNIRFRYISNSNVVFTTKGDGNIKNTIISAFRKKEYEDLIEIDAGGHPVRIRGAVSRPSLSRPTRREQIFIVNGRVVRSQALEKAVSSGYRERLFEGRFPVVFLLIDVDPGMVDVNIHPNKKEIRFHDDDLVISTVSDVITRALAERDAVIKVGDYFKEHSTKDHEKTEQVDVKQILSNRRSSAISDTDNSDLSFVSEPAVPDAEKVSRPLENEPLSTDDFDLDPGRRPFDFADLKPTGCIFDTYITCEDGENFYLIDQHAAHERVFYEKLVGAYLAGEKLSQPLITPLIIDCAPNESEFSDSWMADLKDMGYVIEPFGPDTYIIKEIPTYMDLTEAESFARDFISCSSDPITSSNKVVIDKLITRSCKSAVKAHDHLSMQEIQALLDELSACRNPFSCPHGRPTCIKFTRYEIEKFFKRIQ